MSLIHTGLATPGWRWIKDRLWSLERAFEKTRASGRAEDDTRIRILVVLALLVVGFASLAVGATRRALLQGPDGTGLTAGGAGPGRAPLVDRRGSLLAADLPFFTLYLDPHDVWDKAEVRRGLIATLPSLPVARLDKALNGSRRTFLAGPLSPKGSYGGTSTERFANQIREAGADPKVGAVIVGEVDDRHRLRAAAQRRIDVAIGIVVRDEDR